MLKRLRNNKKLIRILLKIIQFTELTAIRVLPIIANFQIWKIIQLSWEGEAISSESHILSNCILYPFTLLIIAIRRGNIHCMWNYVLWINLIINASIQYIDEEYNVIPIAEMQLNILTYTTYITIALFIFFALRHFYIANKHKINNIIDIINLLFKTIHKKIYEQIPKRRRF